MMMMISFRKSVAGSKLWIPVWLKGSLFIDKDQKTKRL